MKLETLVIIYHKTKLNEEETLRLLNNLKEILKAHHHDMDIIDVRIKPNLD